MKSRNEISAGGIVFRRNETPDENQIEVLICKDAGYHRWVLPKGLVRKNEPHEDTALREVREEVGVDARIVASLGEPEKYIYTARGVRVFKSVHYFLMAYVAGSEQEHDAEMEEVRWVNIDEAVELVAYPQIKDLLRKSKTIIENHHSEGVTK